jgi:hypothetical protein
MRFNTKIGKTANKTINTISERNLAPRGCMALVGIEQIRPLCCPGANAAEGCHAALKIFDIECFKFEGP